MVAFNHLTFLLLPFYLRRSLLLCINITTKNLPKIYCTLRSPHLAKMSNGCLKQPSQFTQVSNFQKEVKEQPVPTAQIPRKMDDSAQK